VGTDNDDSTGKPLNQLRGQILHNWREFPEAPGAELDDLLRAAIAKAADAEAQLITVMNPVSMPRRLRLGTLISEDELDHFYHQEWAELACSDDGRLYLVYRHQDTSGDYAIEWSPATTLPASLQGALPDPLALALLGSDD